jgi:hypothetical protein
MPLRLARALVMTSAGRLKMVEPCLKPVLAASLALATRSTLEGQASVIHDDELAAVEAQENCHHDSV